LDLNRDGIKIETPEVQGLVKNVLSRWDPYVILDSHTHNGSYHQEPVTFVWSLNPNGDTSLIRYSSSVMYHEITENLKNNYDILCIPHGDFLDVRSPEKGWIPLGPQPRYLSNYFGLRNRIGILNENYPYADFETRVNGCYKLFLTLLDFCYQYKDEISEHIRDVDVRTIQRGLNPDSDDKFVISYDVRATGKDITVQGWEMKVEEIPDQRWPKVTKSDKKKTYTIPFLADYYPQRTVRLPFAYLFDGRMHEIANKCHEHGIIIEKTSEMITLEVETFIIKEITNQQRLNQGHYQTSISGNYNMIAKEFPAGTYIVTMSQPLANVASYLLEPESDDGLVKWNFFDRYIQRQWSRDPLPYPVYKVYNPANIARILIK
jgi:hypothetical protein